MAERGRPCECHGIPRQKCGLKPLWRCVVSLREVRRRYQRSAKGKAAKARWVRSASGKATYARSDRKRVAVIGNRSIRVKTDEQARIGRELVQQMRQEYRTSRATYGTQPR